MKSSSNPGGWAFAYLHPLFLTQPLCPYHCPIKFVLQAFDYYKWSSKSFEWRLTPSWQVLSKTPLLLPAVAFSNSSSGYCSFHIWPAIKRFMVILSFDRVRHLLSTSPICFILENKSHLNPSNVHSNHNMKCNDTTLLWFTDIIWKVNLKENWKFS